MSDKPGGLTCQKSIYKRIRTVRTEERGYWTYELVDFVE